MCYLLPVRKKKIQQEKMLLHLCGEKGGPACTPRASTKHVQCCADSRMNEDDPHQQILQYSLTLPHMREERCMFNCSRGGQSGMEEDDFLLDVLQGDGEWGHVSKELVTLSGLGNHQDLPKITTSIPMHLKG